MEALTFIARTQVNISLLKEKLRQDTSLTLETEKGASPARVSAHLIASSRMI
jgi:hypothetical protein